MKINSMKLKQVFCLFLVCFLLQGCDVAKQVGGAYNLTQCKFDYNSISSLKLAGMDLSRGINAVQLLQLTPLLTGQASSVPLNFTLNLDIANPNSSAAFLEGLQYILSIDNVQFTTGAISQALHIAGGGKQTLPLAIGLDLATLLKGETKDAVVNVVKNIVGANDKQSQITLQLRPNIKVGDYTIPSPVYIPVSFAFGGK